MNHAAGHPGKRWTPGPADGSDSGSGISPSTYYKMPASSNIVVYVGDAGLVDSRRM